MTPLFSLFPLIGFSLYWQRFSKNYASVALIQVTSFILFFLYLGALFSTLYLFSFIVWIVGSIFFLHEVFLKKYYKINFYRLIPYFIFVIFVCIYHFLFAERFLFFWDEFSQWGIVSKEIIFTNHIYDSTSNGSNLRYFPGSTIWHYFVNLPVDFNESGLYFAHFILILIPLLIFFERTGKARVYWFMPTSIILLFGLYNFGHGLSNLYVDHLLGAWFVAAVAINFFHSKKSYFIFGNIFIFGVLLLIKDVGALLAFFALSINILIRFHFWKEKNNFFKFISINYKLPIFSAILILFILFSWKINRDNEGIRAAKHSALGVLSGLVKNENIFDEKTKTEMNEKFYEIIFNQQLSKNEISWKYNEFSYGIMNKFTENYKLTVIYFLFSLIALTIYFSIFLKNRKISLVLISFIAIYVVYLYVLKNTYSFVFARSDFPSFIRYFHSIVFPIFAFSILLLSPSISFAGSKKKDTYKFLHAVFLLSLFWFFERPYLKPILDGNQLSSFRQQIQPIVLDLKRKIKDNGKIWVYFPIEENGFMRTMLRYEITPNPVTIVHSKNAISEDIGKVINSWKQSNYLWFPVRPPQQESGFSELFTNSPPSQLYKVSIDQNNLSLQPL